MSKHAAYELIDLPVVLREREALNTLAMRFYGTDDVFRIMYDHHATGPASLPLIPMSMARRYILKQINLSLEDLQLDTGIWITEPDLRSTTVRVSLIEMFAAVEIYKSVLADHR